MIDKPGCYKINEEEYHHDCVVSPSLSRGTIKTLLSECPYKAFFEHPRLNPSWIPEKEETKFDIGTAAHTLFLQGIDKAVALDFPDWRKKEAQAARDAARQAGMIPLLIEQYERVRAMVEVANKSLMEANLRGVTGLEISQGESEATYIWQEKNGVWCRIRVDHINRKHKIILDYKTTSSSVQPEKFANTVSSMEYEIQDVFYRRGVQAIEGEDYDFWFMAQEVEPPYLCSFVEIDMMLRDMGEEKVQKGIKLWHDCLKSGNWPGYPLNGYVIEAKPWSLAQWEFRKATL